MEEGEVGAGDPEIVGDGGIGERSSEEIKAEDDVIKLSSEENGAQIDEDMDCSDDPEVLQDPINGGNHLKRKEPPALEDGPCVEIKFKRLPRESRKRLQEWLLHWADWHASQNFEDDGLVEDGTDTYFPSLQIGNSRMRFWIDKPCKRPMIDVEQNEVPLYDRGCETILQTPDTRNKSEGHLEIQGEASRCFNCGSYSHALKDCQRRKDYTAISSARKNHMLKKGSSTPTHRYYESPTGGKFDDIKPGVLLSETKQSLGIGEHDPPPWLYRMREIGYPPGYIEVDEEASGLVMFGSDNPSLTTEDGEIIELEPSSKSQKMTVEFPGINAPIPENADKQLWSSPASRPKEPEIEYRRSLSDNSRRHTYSDEERRRDEMSYYMERHEATSSRRESTSSRHEYTSSSRREPTSSRYESRHESTSSRSRERGSAWALAQAALESVRSRK